MRSKVQVWIYREVATAGARTIKVLLLRTTSERGGFWQPVTGSVEEGESLEAAALREALEETALDFMGAPRSLCFSFDFDGRWGRAREHFLALQARTDEVKLDLSEHVESEWVDLDEVEGRLAFDSNREGWNRLRLGLLGSK